MLYIKHIEQAKGMITVAQAHISLIALRIHYMQNIPQALAACKEFADSPYANDPALARQAANAIYGNAAAYQEKDRGEMLKQAETLLRRAAAGRRAEAQRNERALQIRTRERAVSGTRLRKIRCRCSSTRTRSSGNG